MIAEFHREKNPWPSVLLLAAIAVACFLLPPLARGIFIPAASVPEVKKIAVPKLPFAPERPTEPVAGEPSEQ